MTPSRYDYALKQAEEGRKLIMGLDDVDKILAYLDGLHLPWVLIAIVLIVVAGSVAKAWIKRK